MTQTELEATTLRDYLSKRGYTIVIHTADPSGIVMTISRDALPEDLGTAPLRHITPTTPPFIGAQQRNYPRLPPHTAPTKPTPR
jgi:hypothetical protein